MKIKVKPRKKLNHNDIHPELINGTLWYLACIPHVGKVLGVLNPKQGVKLYCLAKQDVFLDQIPWTGTADRGTCRT